MPHRLQSVDPFAKTRADIEHAPQQGHRLNQPLWMNSREAAAYVGNKSVRAFYAWRKAHHIFTNNMGRVSRRDLDRVLSRPRKKRQMATASLANLRQRKAG